jgi:hypothetical protein
MKDAKDGVSLVLSTILKLRMAKQSYEADPSMKADEYEDIEEELMRDLDYNATNAMLAMDRAMVAADRAECAKQEALDVLRDAWAKMRKLVA